MTECKPRRSPAAALYGLALAGALQAQAQGIDACPSRPIRFVIPTAAGGNMDLLARLVAEKLSASWGQVVNVESKPGANTMLATTEVAKAPADGYTVLLTISGFVQNLVLQPNPPYKLGDLAPVTIWRCFRSRWPAAPKCRRRTWPTSCGWANCRTRSATAAMASAPAVTSSARA